MVLEMELIADNDFLQTLRVYWVDSVMSDSLLPYGL